MALNYKPLWMQLAKKGLNKTDVIAMAGLTTNVMAQMGKDKPITFKNLEKICNALDCTPNDIISFEDNFSDEEQKMSLRTEDQVRDYAKLVLGFDETEENVVQETGQITTFNQLSFKGYSDKPDGWCLPKNMNDVAIIRGLNIRNLLENTPTKTTAPTYIKKKQ